MKYFFLKNLYGLSPEDLLLLRARKKFSSVSREYLSRGLDDRDVWNAFAVYNSDLSQATEKRI